VNYICPVKGAAEVLVAADPEIAKNPLIFPPADILAKLHIFGGMDEATEKYFNDKFSTVTGLG
jgi:spermidine/putrescine transport system substrate-binding protein